VASRSELPVRLAPALTPEVAAIEEALKAASGSPTLLLLPDRAHPAIPADLRRRWARRLFPTAEVAVSPPGFPRHLLPGGAAKDVATDEWAQLRAAVRADPLGEWGQLHPVVRPDYLVRVAVVGAESVGKTTLTRRLAERLGGEAVDEYGRDAYPWGDPAYRARPEHFTQIVRGHGEALREAERTAERYLISDTEAWTTEVWAEFYMGGQVPVSVVQAGRNQRFDLVLYLEADVPWVSDGVRTWQDERAEFAARLLERVEESAPRVVRIGGGWEDREAAALAAIRALGTPRAPFGVEGRWP
jgi:nicotinamide riboside kinase